jgi:transposase
MNSEQLFGMALGLHTPWQVDGIEFKPGAAGGEELHLTLGFARGSRFADAKGQACPVHDTVSRTWQHLNFFEHACYLHCQVPRIKTSEGKVETVPVPWARPGSGFTLLFEALAMALIEREMPVKRVAEMLRVNPQRVWTVFNHWVCEARKRDDPSAVTRLGFDETSSRKGHDYITIGVDMDAKRLLHAEPGKGQEAIVAIQRYLASQEVKPEQVVEASMDMSPAFMAGVAKAFPKAKITFDRFHVVKLLNEAMDTVRKLEQRESKALKGHKYTFLKDWDRLSDKRRLELVNLMDEYPRLGEAYRLKALFNDLWAMPNTPSAEAHLAAWTEEVQRSGIQPFMQFAKTVKSHWTGIVRFIESRLTNGLLEGINHKIQLAKRRARGYRNIHNFINMAYFLCGKLDFSFPKWAVR